MKIAYFAPIYFDYLKQRPQHFAELLSKKHEIIYIEPTISLMKYLLKRGTSFHKIDYQVNPNLRVIRVGGGFTVHKSLDYFDVFNMNSISEYIQLEKYVRDCDLIWTGYPGWYNLISRYKGKKLVYDKMDEDSQIATNYFLKESLKNKEEKLIKSADLIFVSCQKFFDQLQEKHSNVKLLQNGVMVDFVPSIEKICYDELARFGLSSQKTIFGYVGTISHWFDFEVLHVILEANPNNEIVLVGNNMMPEMKHERVHYVAPVKKEQVAGIIEQFDVCLYNFKRNDLLDTINPVKIYEYLAMNKPVLAVESMETRQFGDKLLLYEKKEDIRNILSVGWNCPFRNGEERRKFIDSNSWESRVQLIEQELKNIHGRKIW